MQTVIIPADCSPTVLSRASSCPLGIKGFNYYGNFHGSIMDITFVDNKHAFVEMISSVAYLLGGYDELIMSEMFGTIMWFICSWNAVKCATALFEEPISLKLDLNAIISGLHSTPLQTACPSLGLMELFIRNGARADIRYCDGTLLLDEVFDIIRNKLEFTGGFPEQSIYMTIIFLCKQGELLKAVRLLFENTEEVENEIKRYVKEGKLIEIAALLMVVREEVTSPSFFKGLHDSTLNGSMSLRQLTLSEIASLTASQITLVSTGEEMQELKNKLETMTCMLRLIEVFERVGDKIELLLMW